MNNVMNYSDEILYDVREVIYRIMERGGGMAPQSFLQAEYKRLQGRYAAIVINVALMAMGKKAAIQDARFPLSDAQYASLVERAKQNSRVELARIAQMRAEKGK